MKLLSVVEDVMIAGNTNTDCRVRTADATSKGHRCREQTRQDIFLEQPEDFEKPSETGEKLVYKLKKSLYGLRPSGRNWYKLCKKPDHCGRRKEINVRQTDDNDVILVVIWVDDLIHADST